MRKFWLTLAMLALLMCVFAVSVSAANVVDSGKCGDNVTWTLYDDGELVIEGTGAMWDGTAISNETLDAFSYDSPWEANNNSISTITIKPGVTGIGEGNFYNCIKLTSVTIPDSVTSIGPWAFAECIALSSISIPDSVTTIGGCAFAHCDALLSMVISKNVTDIGTNAFASCDSLLSIIIDQNNKNYTSIDGVLFNKEKTELIRFPGGKSGTYRIPNGITTVEWLAFSECTLLTSVIIPESVEYIDYVAFYQCENLTSVTILSTDIIIADDGDNSGGFAAVFDECSPSLTIRGYSGSTSETYAKQIGYTFVALNAPETEPPVIDTTDTDSPAIPPVDANPSDPTSPDAVADTAASDRGTQIRHTLWISFVVVFCVVIAVYELIHLRNKNTKDESES